jgi:tRNA threonylcarbamoyl adenosine modification protein YjeE
MNGAADEARALERHLPDEQATARLGEDIAMALRAGDVLALSGDLGAGKTTLARGLIRAMAGDAGLDVPSPTFTLVQSYQTRVPLHHFDLYRIAQAGELDELGLDEMLSDGAALIEWPDRAGGRLPRETVTLELAQDGDGRHARISGSGSLSERIARSLAMREFLAGAGWGDASRHYFTGDASARSYETVMLGDEDPRVLMNSPRLVLGPPVRDGKPYAVIAHTAQSVAAFVAIDRALAEGGVSVPTIFARDLDAGFLLLDHLGSDSFLDHEGRPVAGRYAAAAELLAYIHGRTWSSTLEAAPGVVHEVPPFDRDAMMIEIELLLDWYVPYATGRPAGDALRAGFRSAWNAALDRIESAEKSLMLRDFHSPNIIWRRDRQGHDRLGIVDFQDALIGPSAYDVASLAMDARVTVPPDIEQVAVNAYVAARKKAGPFDEAAFAEGYAVMAAQRNSKILGIFVRLNERDGKPAYLKHLPRIRAYLERALSHPALGELRGFYLRNGLIGDGPA